MGNAHSDKVHSVTVYAPSVFRVRRDTMWVYVMSRGLVGNLGVMCGWCLTLSKIALVVGSKEQNFYETMCAQVSLVRNSRVTCTNVMKNGRDRCFRNQRMS